jgi:hypothetical protein
VLLPPFGRYGEADALVEQVKVGPGTAWAPVFHRISVGRLHEGLDVARGLLELNPLDPNANHIHGYSQWFAGRYRDAEATLSAALERWPNNQQTACDLVLMAAWRGDWASVDALLAPERLARFPLRELERSTVGFAMVMRDDSTQSRRRPTEALRRQLERTGTIDFVTLSFAAEVGAADEVFQIAEQARFGPAGGERDAMGFDAYRPNFLFHPMYPRFRSDPRFVRVCAKLGLVEYWLATGKWPDCADDVPYDFRRACAAGDLPSKQAFGVALR